MNLSFYRFFFRQHDITVHAEVFECDGDASALKKAKELLSNSQHGSWKSGRARAGSAS